MNLNAANLAPEASMPNCAQIDCNPGRIPDALELCALIDGLVNDWAFLTAEPDGIPAPGPAPMELEFGVSIAGPRRFLLVLRSNLKVASELALGSTGDPAARSQAADSFRELCHLSARRLARNFLGGTAIPYKCHTPQPSHPDFWPAWAPLAECVLLVAGFPLEVRLWLERDNGELLDKALGR
jgi:hypothetical protein